MDAREYQQIVNKQQRLPEQYERAISRVRHIEAEMIRYGMAELLRNPQLIDRAWDETIRDAQDDARRNGDSIGFGDNGQ